MFGGADDCQISVGWAELCRNVLEELEHGELKAFSDFVHKETTRVLRDIPGLVIPGC